MKRSLLMLAGAIVLMAANSVLGDTLTMQCTRGICVRARCDDWRENCSAIGTFQRRAGAYSVPRAHRVCNEFGDCRFALPSLMAVRR
jgi:hypothetical protein